MSLQKINSGRNELLTVRSVESNNMYLSATTSSANSIISNNSGQLMVVDTGVSKLDLSDDIKEKMFTEFMSKLSRVPTVKHECHSCGGTVEFNADKHIFICPYCGSCYAVGTAMVNSTY